jgi:hypothetical protein
VLSTGRCAANVSPFFSWHVSKQTNELSTTSSAQLTIPTNPHNIAQHEPIVSLRKKKSMLLCRMQRFAATLLCATLLLLVSAPATVRAAHDPLAPTLAAIDASGGCTQTMSGSLIDCPTSGDAAVALVLQGTKFGFSGATAASVCADPLVHTRGRELTEAVCLLKPQVCYIIVNLYFCCGISCCSVVCVLKPQMPYAAKGIRSCS